MALKEKKTERIVVCLGKTDYEALDSLASKERISVSGLVRHFIIRKIYDPLNGTPKTERGSK